MSQEPVNVFDFLLDSETPNASLLELPAPEPMNLIQDTPQTNKNRDLVRVRFHDEAAQSISDLVEYGSGPVSTMYETPAPREDRERRKERRDREQSREDKRKSKTLTGS